MISELSTENEQLRSLLKIRDEFHVPDMTAYLSETLKRAESSLAAATQAATSQDISLCESSASTLVNVKEMVAEAAIQIKKQANERKMEE